MAPARVELLQDALDRAQAAPSLELRGRGDLDHSALLTYLEDLAAHRVGQVQS